MKTDFPKILLCEDDLSLGIVIKKYFEMNDYEVIIERDGKMGLAAFKKYSIDLCLLDVMMPNMDGFQLAEEIRNISKEVPIIFITAKSMKIDTMKGYNVGANDYITKPFDIEILQLKVKALLKNKLDKQAEGLEEVTLILGTYTYHLKTRELNHKKQHNFLSPTEGKLLQLLYKYKDSCLPRDTALKEIWGDASHYTGRSMDVYITRLRKYLQLDTNIEIINIHSTGFQLILPINSKKK